MTDPRNRQYTNGEITVFWIPSKCIHATTCFRELIEVFNPGRRPWVNMQGAPTRRITEVVNKCPTQAIIWKYNKDLTDSEKALQRSVPGMEDNVEAAEENPETITKSEKRVKPVNVKIMKDGPIVVEGNFKVIGHGDKELRSAIMTSFCRCGGSRSLPYCDGSHRKIGFTEENS